VKDARRLQSVNMKDTKTCSVILRAYTRTLQHCKQCYKVFTHFKYFEYQVFNYYWNN